MWELGDRGSQSPPFTKSLLFSISLLGKPPHSSIMSMATGKNLQSIPKKVSNVEPCEPRPFLRNVGVWGGETWGRDRGFRQNFPQPEGRWWHRVGKDLLPPGPARFLQGPLSPGPEGPQPGSDGPLLFLQTQHYFLFCFLLKFSLTVSSCLVCFGFTLQSFCDSSRARSLTNCSSIMLRRWVLTSRPPPGPPPAFPGPGGGLSPPLTLTVMPTPLQPGLATSPTGY